MELEFIFRDTAFQHGLTEADIRHAFETCCYVDQYENRENVYLLLAAAVRAKALSPFLAYRRVY